MKKLLLCGICITLVAGPALAEEESPPAPEPSAYACVTVATGYNWRGQLLDDRAVIQPYFEVTRHGVLFSAWANANLSERNYDGKDFTEVDLTASYTLPIEAAEIAVGVVGYLPIGVEAERYHEAFVTAAYPNSWVTPRIEAYQSFKANHGFYLLAGLARDFELLKNLTLSADLSSGYGSSKFNEYSYSYEDGDGNPVTIDGSKMNDGNASLSLRYAIGDAVSITPAVRYTWQWDSELRDAQEALSGSDPNMFIGSLMLDYSF